MLQFTNARAYCLDPGTGAYSIARSITVDGPAILAVGHDTVAGVAPIDLAGATIVPAFADSHVHLDATGMRDGPNDLSEIGSAAAFDDRLEAIAVGPRMYAAGFDDALWTEPASARVLDSRHAEAIALVVRVDGHSSIVNRKTWHWLDLDPALDGVVRDAHGEPTGRLFREANWQAQARYFATISTSERRAATGRACTSALAQGIVYLHAQLLTLGSRRAYADEVAYLRSLENVHVFPKICERDPELALALGLPFVGGDVFLDGSLGSGTAALCEPYRDRPGNGALALSDAEADAYFAEAEALGISAGVHAIGDRAIEQALQAIERAQGSKRSVRTRHFIEHAELASDYHLAACARLGVHLSMQPQFDAQWGSPGGMYDTRLGPQRRATMNRIRSARIAGVHVSGGSDSPVCHLSALDGMAAACAHHDPAERLDPLEALTLYTYEAARLAHAERSTGAIAPGFEASFAILDSDPFVNGSFAQTRVIGTWHRGRNVYRAV